MANSFLKENVVTNNVILVQVLGICSALAVTNNMQNTMIMALGVMFVTALSSFTISIIKDFIPRKVRMIVQVIIIAFFTVIVDIILKAYVPAVSKQLGPYVGLIITNCIIMGRMEAYAQLNAPIPSLIDGITSALGYMVVMVAISFFRELLGSGTLFNIQIMPEEFTKYANNWNIMVMPPSAFFFIGFFVAILNNTVNKKEEGGKK